MSNLPEVWLRGAIPGIDSLLQPVAHALLQSQEEVHRYTANLADELLWIKPAGVASIGFHLQHLKGVSDRLFTYASGNPLSPEQLEYLQKEGVPDHTLTIKDLVASFDKQIDQSISFLKNLPPGRLTEFRPVGRKGLPSTVLGLLFHAAEHTQRHIGQLYVTIKVVTGGWP